MMKVPTSRRVLLLYRQILKQGKTLQYTDYDFFRRSVRREFEQQKDEVEIKVIKEQYEKGMYFLRTKLGGLQ